MLKRFCLTLCILMIIGIACSNSPIASLFATPTATHTLTPTATQTPTPTLTPTPTETPTQTLTPEPQTGYSITELENGWQLYQNFEMDFSLTLPPNWAVLDLTADDFQLALEEVVKNNPEMDDFLSSDYLANLVAVGIKLIAMDTSYESLSSGSATNLNFLILDLPFQIPLDDYIKLNIDQLKNMLGEDLTISQETVKIIGQDAVRLAYTTELASLFGEQIQVYYLQYYLLIGKTQYVLTFTTTGEQFEEYEPLFDQIAQTLQLGE